MQKWGVVGSTRLNFPDGTHVFILFWPVASAFLPLPIQLLSITFVITLDGSIAQCFLHLFACLICLFTSFYWYLLVWHSYLLLHTITSLLQLVLGYVITGHARIGILNIKKFTQLTRLVSMRFEAIHDPTKPKRPTVPSLDFTLESNDRRVFSNCINHPNVLAY